MAVANALPDKLPHGRAGRRGRQQHRHGRQQVPDNLYGAPAAETPAETGYGAPAPADDGLAAYGAAEETPDTDYGAPVDTGYGAPAEENIPEYDDEVAPADEELGTSYGSPDEEIPEVFEEAVAPSDQYGVADDQATYAEEEQAVYGDDQDAQPSDVVEDDAAGDPLAMLMKSVPGIPGEDYPIFAEAPETSFACDGQVNGGTFVPIKHINIVTL